MPSTSLSNLLQTDPEVLHLPRAQLVPASPAWDKLWGPRGFWDPSWVSHTPGHHSMAAGHKINHPGCPLTQGHNPAATPQLLQPSDTPEEETVMAPKPPNIPEWHWGAQQKPQSTELPHSLQQLTALSGDNTLLRPPRAPQGGQGQPPAKGTGWHRWHSLGHPEQHKPVPQSPQGGDSSRCPRWQWNLAAGSQGGVPR